MAGEPIASETNPMASAELIRNTLDLFEEPNHDALQKLLHVLTTLFPDAPGSHGAHHDWSGGYLDHVAELFQIAYKLYAAMDGFRALRFDLTSAWLVLFLHDIEKPFKYAEPNDLRRFWDHLGYGNPAWRPGKSDKVFQAFIVEKFDIQVSKSEWNALRFVEGEGDGYVPGMRAMNELAAFCHMCDVASARIWWDYPQDHPEREDS